MCLNPGRRQHEATVAGAAQKTLTHLRCKQHPARVRVEIPQPLRLWERQRDLAYRDSRRGCDVRVAVTTIPNLRKLRSEAKGQKSCKHVGFCDVGLPRHFIPQRPCGMKRGLRRRARGFDRRASPRTTLRRRSSTAARRSRLRSRLAWDRRSQSRQRSQSDRPHRGCCWPHAS